MSANPSSDPNQEDVEELRQTIARLQDSIDVQQRVAYAAGLFHGDITISTLIASFGEGLLVIDAQQRLVLVNQQLQTMFGYSDDELIGQSVQRLLPERLSQTHQQHIKAFFQDPHVRPMGQGLELLGRRKDGAEFPVEISLSFLNTKAGRFALAFVTDITRRKQAERELQQQNAALNAFAYTVAHDLQASLSIILGMSEHLLITREELSAQQLHAQLMMIAKASRKMSRIITELLMLASLRQDEVPMRVVDMEPLIEAALERLSETIEQQGAKVNYARLYSPVMGYGPWLEEVWFNYISNALKYGGQPPQIEIGSTARPDGYVRFWVKDHGPGIPVEQQTRLFTPNDRLNTVRALGYGLGLSIVKQIVETLNGQVYIESTPGEGSVFGFSLPKA